MTCEVPTSVSWRSTSASRRLEAAPDDNVAVYSSSRIGVPLGINGTGRPLVSGIIAS